MCNQRELTNDDRLRGRLAHVRAEVPVLLLQDWQRQVESTCLQVAPDSPVHSTLLQVASQLQQWSLRPAPFVGE
jgi:hypothetical protein